MRRFRFRLEAVLKHRLAVEDQRLRAFGLVQTEMSACEARLTALRDDFDRTLGGRPGVVDVSDFGRRERYLDAVSARIAAEERIREGIAARLADARTELVAARQARESVERIRESDYAAYMAAAAREEQAAIDEMATMRFRRASG